MGTNAHWGAIRASESSRGRGRQASFRQLCTPLLLIELQGPDRTKEGPRKRSSPSFARDLGGDAGPAEPAQHSARLPPPDTQVRH